MNKLKSNRLSTIRGATIPIIAMMILLTICCQHSKNYPVDVNLDPNIFRSGEKGDNWCSTWGADGALYTAQCDGRGWLDEKGDSNGNLRTHMFGGLQVARIPEISMPKC